MKDLINNLKENVQIQIKGKGYCKNQNMVFYRRRQGSIIYKM